MADPGVHDGPIRLFAIHRSARSRSAEIRTIIGLAAHAS